VSTNENVMELNPLKIIALLLVLMSMTLGISAQSLKPSDDLYKEIAHQDSTLFNAFNSRDVETFKNTFAPDLEFYHDKGGLTDLNYTVESLKRTAAQNNGLRRELVPGSMEVYPIPNYGAMQIAAHTFCHSENGKQDCGTFKFVHVWHKTPAGWKLARVVSYGH
jgi:hypothetical protein